MRYICIQYSQLETAEVVCDTMLGRGYNARDGIELYWDDRVFNRTVWNSENVPWKE